MGIVDLRSHAHRLGHHSRPPGRSLRPAAFLHFRLSALCRQLRPLRRSSVGGTDYFVSRPASGRRRDDFRQWARRGLDRIPVERTRQSHGSELDGLPRRFSYRPHPRRISYRHPRLALDLFYQSSGRHLGRIPGVEAAGGKPGKGRTHFHRFSRRDPADDDLQFVDLRHESVAPRRLARPDGAAPDSACLWWPSRYLFSSNCAPPCRS